MGHDLSRIEPLRKDKYFGSHFKLCIQRLWLTKAIVAVWDRGILHSVARQYDGLT
jgi:hypothetical protein